MNLTEVMQELESYGSEQIKNIALKHGVKEPLFGVRVQDMKKIVKKVKKDYELSLALYNTGNSDAMYLAGLIADETKMTKDDLQQWVENASNHGISQYTVAWITAESKFGYELGLEWIESENELIATAGWSSLAYHASLTPDAKIDINCYKKLLKRIDQTIHSAPNQVRYNMNAFVIAVGSYISELNPTAIEVATSIGKVQVYMGDTSCKVPFASDYIKKVMNKGNLGKKRKKARC